MHKIPLSSTMSYLRIPRHPLLPLLLLGLFLTALAAVWVFPALGATMTQDDIDAIERARAQMEDIGNQAEGLAKEQQRIAAEQKTVLGEMKVLSNEIAVLEKEIQDLTIQIEDKEVQIEELAGDIVIKTGEVDERTAFLNSRLLQIYKDGDLSVLDVLFASASLTDFLTRYDLMQKVVENDIGLLTGLKDARTELEGQKAALEEIRSGLEEEKETRQQKSTVLNQQWAKQSSMSRALEADLALTREAEDELEELNKKLEKFIADIQAKYKEAYMGSGNMAWPVPGVSRITSDFGDRYHPILRVNRFHSGIDIGAPRETKVVAAEAGKVIMAATYGGYGKTVIIDHGGGVASQYSHLNSINVSVGQRVYKGDKVGGVGTTGLSTGYHLHFQIMIDGKAVDPRRNGKYYVNPS